MKSLWLMTAVAVLAACRPSVRPVRVDTPVAPSSAGVAANTTASTPAAPLSQPAADEPVLADEVPRPVVAPARDPAAILAEVGARLVDVFFEYDRDDLTGDALSAVQHNVRLLEPIVSFPQLKIIIEGHCDERGSAEYNLALGDRRANRAAEAMRDLGLAQAKLETVTFGREMPQCTDPNEACWRKNRRAHIVLRDGGL